MANLKFSGEIEAVARNGKNFKIGEKWFSVFKAAQMKGAQKGDVIEFEYQEKDVGGTTFNNVQGDLKVTGSSGGAVGTDAPAGASGGGRSSSGYGKNDPLIQKSIVRQNSLTQANALFSSMFGMLGNEFFELSAVDEAVALVIDMARKFEEYSSGAAE